MVQHSPSEKENMLKNVYQLSFTCIKNYIGIVAFKKVTFLSDITIYIKSICRISF